MGKVSAVGPGVHIDAAADGSRDAVGKFHAPKACLCSEHRPTGHGDPRHQADMGLIQSLHTKKAVFEANGEAGKPLIRGQYVGSCPQYSGLAVQ